MKYIKKGLFFNIINKFNNKMNLYDLVRIYYNITDNIFPNYIHEINNSDVYNRLYSNRKISTKSCCTEHFNFEDYQYLVFNNLITDYEYKKYLKANQFFLKLIDLILEDLKYINRSKYIEKKKEFKIFYNCNTLFWNWISNNIKLNRKGDIKQIL
jgi:hypothetical protein